MLGAVCTYPLAWLTCFFFPIIPRYPYTKLLWNSETYESNKEVSCLFLLSARENAYHSLYFPHWTPKLSPPSHSLVERVNCRYRGNRLELRRIGEKSNKILLEVKLANC